MNQYVNKSGFYDEIKTLIEQSRSNIYRAVNFAMVQTYWQIGERIVEEEQAGKARAGYGEYLIEMLAERLTADFGKGFDKRNLFYMRRFYLAFPIMNALRSQLSWTHYRFLIQIENQDEREYYLNEAANEHWSTRQLERQIQTNCLVLIDLKIGTLTAEDVGKMDFYVRMYEEKFKPADDNPTLGIILCSQSDETVVKYSLLNDRKQIFASQYQLVIPSEKMLAKVVDDEIQHIKNENILREKLMHYGKL